jgi:hypothetical protein
MLLLSFSPGLRLPSEAALFCGDHSEERREGLKRSAKKKGNAAFAADIQRSRETVR